ncbi:MAG: hypothetical protein ABI992_11680, partial [Chthoniobacterales bacterium]
FGLFWRLTQGVTAARVAWTTVVAVLSVQTLYTNSLLVFAFAVAAVAVTARRRQWRTALVILAIGAIAAVSLLPYLSLFWQMQAWASLGQVNFSLSNSLFKLYIALLGSAHALLWLWVAMLSLSLVLAVWWQRSVPALEQSVESRDLALYGLICAVLAFVGTMGFYRAVGWGTNVWYYLPMLAAMAAGVDLILAQSRFHWAALARGGIGLLGVALLSRVVFGFSEFRASNIDLIANILGERATPGDLVVVWPSAEGITFQRYVKPSVDWTSIPTAPHLPSIPGDDFMLPYRERNSLRPTLDRIRQTLQDGHRVWVASTWPLQPFPDGRPREIEPLTSSFRPPAGYYLRGWGYQLVEELQRDAASISRVQVDCDQPINPYEQSSLTVFFREKQPTPAP